ncbi:MAG: ABC transporter permease [Neisseriaceae bacterium]
MNLFKNIYSYRVTLWNLIKSDFKNRYLGNHFGIIWAFIQPLVMILVYWFVFTHGFKTTPIENVPFLPWLLAGIVPWFLISDAIVGSSRAIIDQSFLVKKIVFEVKLLPIIKIGSAIFVNIAFWILLIVCLLLYGFYPTLLWIQIFYYILCILALVLGFGLLLAAITPFILDVGQFVSIFIQIMFWATPIFWNQDILPHSYIFIVKLNPFAYIIGGIRDALLFNKPFWVHYNVTIYFWCLVIGLFLLGNHIFNKLRPHFADVL